MIQPLRKKYSDVYSVAVQIPVSKGMVIKGGLTLPAEAIGLVIFAHRSDSRHLSSRNCYIAEVLQQHKVGTLLTDLLTEAGEKIDRETQRLGFEMPLLAGRLIAISNWIRSQPILDTLPIGYFGAGTGAAATLIAAAHQADRIRAIVSRGGHPDLAMEHLPHVQAPTLLIVGEHDEPVLSRNRQALENLNDRSRMAVVPRATHLFEEPGTLEGVAHMAAHWFAEHFAKPLP